MSEKEDIKEEHKTDIAKSVFTGVIFGAFALVGTFVGNYLWFISKDHVNVHYIGIAFFIVFFILLAFLGKWAIDVLSK